MSITVPSMHRYHPELVKVMGGKYDISAGNRNPLRTETFSPILEKAEKNGKSLT